MIALKQTDNKNLVLGNTNFSLAIKRSQRRRRTVALVVEAPDQLSICVPQNTQFITIEKILKRRARWIFRKAADIAEFVRFKTKKEKLNGSSIYYLGRHYRLRFTDKEDIQQKCKLNGSWLEINSSSATYLNIIINWYKLQAKRIINQRALFWCEKFNVKFKQLIISDQKKRWGSCSADNVIRINWRIITATLFQIDYVIAHELCHILHKDHSEKFWKLLGSIMPDYEKRKNGLKKIYHLNWSYNLTL